jgi:tRNA-splicing ligase RtcB
MSKKIKESEILELGFPKGKIATFINEILNKKLKKEDNDSKLALLRDLAQHPQHYIDHEYFGFVAEEILRKPQVIQPKILAETPKNYPIYGKEWVENGALQQMEIAMRLPVAVAGALMPDAHQGYGLPIGGVLATENSIIPYGVGVDIGCRMCLTVYDLPIERLQQNKEKFKDVLEENTRFGRATFHKPKEHEILDRTLFQEIKLLKNLKDKAFQQLGSSGSGNHFVEFGIVEIIEDTPEIQLKAGKYIALLSHSGSRGLGAAIANHYTQLARELCPLPKEAAHLAWLNLDTQEGQEYWLAMNLAGDYASACHDQIHWRIAKALGEKPLVKIENHHNFAWKELDDNGKEWIVHRKGATPAGKDVLGIIPGSMTDAGFIVKGKGNILSLNSASHGAGRVMSRSKAKETITASALKKHLKERGVELIGGGLDEAPMVYKNIHQVMAAQENLVEVLGTFLPKIVRMCGDDSPAED